MMKQALQNQKGFTLVEGVIYVAVMVILSVGAVTLLLSLNNLFQLYKTQKILFDSSVTAVERIAVEIRNADGLDGSSILNDPDGKLSLNNNGTLVDFSLLGNSLMAYQGGVLEDSLTQDQVEVDYFYVYHYTNAETEMARVRFRLIASTTDSVASHEVDFAAVLRESYAP